jgi:hypothetical protein
MSGYIGLWQLVGFSVTSLLGTILHFLYEWTGEAIWIAPFSGVNESTWEHMKLLFWPTFIFAITEYFFFRRREDFWLIKLRGSLLGLSLIPIIFYTYNGVIGKSPDWVNIAIFFVSTAAVYFYEARLFSKAEINCKRKTVPLVLLCLIGALFVLFTFRTPKIGIFLDPITKSYGM